MTREVWGLVGLPAALAAWHLLEFSLGLGFRCLADECRVLKNLVSYSLIAGPYKLRYLVKDDITQATSHLKP